MSAPEVEKVVDERETEVCCVAFAAPSERDDTLLTAWLDARRARVFVCVCGCGRRAGG